MALARAAARREKEQKKKDEQKTSRVQVTVIQPGDAFNFPKTGDSVSIHYITELEDGTVIDNSYKRGQPLNIILGAGHVIPGWEEVIPNMSKGEKSRIIVPPALAYGDNGYPPIIPPNAKLIFEIELLSLSSQSYQERTKRG